MVKPVAIENIEAMRREHGIDDVQLRAEIQALGVGDLVKLTFQSGTADVKETLPVRITSIRGSAFHGELAARPTSGALSSLRVRAPLTFTASHIHSVQKRLSTHEQ